MFKNYISWTFFGPIYTMRPMLSHAVNKGLTNLDIQFLEYLTFFVAAYNENEQEGKLQ